MKGRKTHAEDGSVLWRCDHCGGLAKWTFIDGAVYYHCQRECDGFMQLDMFRVLEYIDRVGSVSASEQSRGSGYAEAEEWEEAAATDSDLPF